METKIISAFPGTGKTWFTNQDWYLGSESVSDSDSSKFPKDQFPQNYIEHIKSLIGVKSIVFVSSHKVVREALYEAEIPFTLIYPDQSLKDEYIGRYYERGSAPEFLKLVSTNWDIWMQELREQKGCKRIVLKAGQFISNVIR